MSFRLVDADWERELAAAFSVDADHVRFVCPFIKKGALGRLLEKARPRVLRVITRFSLVDCAEGVSDLAALRLLLERGAMVRGGAQSPHEALRVRKAACNLDVRESDRRGAATQP